MDYEEAIRNISGHHRGHTCYVYSDSVLSLINERYILPSTFILYIRTNVVVYTLEIH